MKIYNIFEDFTKDSIANTLLKNLIINIMKTFNGENDVFGENELDNLVLIDIEKSTVNDTMEKNIHFSFQDFEHLMNVLYIIRPFSNTDDDEYSSYLKIDLYDLESTDYVVGERIELMSKEIDGLLCVCKKDNDQKDFILFERFLIESVTQLKDNIENKKHIE